MFRVSQVFYYLVDVDPCIMVVYGIERTVAGHDLIPVRIPPSPLPPDFVEGAMVVLQGSLTSLSYTRVLSLRRARENIPPLLRLYNTIIIEACQNCLYAHTLYTGHMPKLIFDIETVGVDFDSLDEQAQGYLLKSARSPEEADQVREGLGFSPLTGEIVAIGILNPDTDRGGVYFQAPGATLETTEEDGVQYVPCSEKDILKNFWDIITHYDQFVTFNGRSFDCPFIMVRSAVHKLKPTKNLMPNRYWDAHIDLYDRLGFFGAVRRTMSLHMWCRALGIKSPKEGGVTGYQVADFFKQGKYLEIAKYCFGDIRATAKLHEYWEKYINVK